MGRSQESFGKKEVKKKKEKKRKDKEEKRLARKENTRSGLDAMIAYVDEFGRITDQPPDMENRTEISAEDIELSNIKQSESRIPDYMRTGSVSFFNSNKGFGFIKDDSNNQSVFFHVKDLEEMVSENSRVSFKISNGPKGPTAQDIKIIK